MLLLRMDSASAYLEASATIGPCHISSSPIVGKMRQQGASSLAAGSQVANEGAAQREDRHASTFLERLVQVSHPTASYKWLVRREVRFNRLETLLPTSLVKRAGLGSPPSTTMKLAVQPAL